MFEIRIVECFYLFYLFHLGKTWFLLSAFDLKLDVIYVSRGISVFSFHRRFLLQSHTVTSMYANDELANGGREFRFDAGCPGGLPGEDKDQICVGQCTASRAASKQLLVDPVRSPEESSSVIDDPDARHVAAFCVSTTVRPWTSGPTEWRTAGEGREPEEREGTRRGLLYGSWRLSPRCKRLDITNNLTAIYSF